MTSLLRTHAEILEGRANGTILATPLHFPRKESNVVHRGDWAIKHGHIIVNKRFEKMIDAWNWAMWNYKGQRNWKIVSAPLH